VNLDHDSYPCGDTLWDRSGANAEAACGLDGKRRFGVVVTRRRPDGLEHELALRSDHRHYVECVREPDVGSPSANVAVALDGGSRVGSPEA
jgi:hypothetical protein